MPFSSAQRSTSSHWDLSATFSRWTNTGITSTLALSWGDGQGVRCNAVQFCDVARDVCVELELHGSFELHRSFEFETVNELLALAAHSVMIHVRRCTNIPHAKSWKLVQFFVPLHATNLVEVTVRRNDSLQQLPAIQTSAKVLYMPGHTHNNVDEFYTLYSTWHRPLVRILSLVFLVSAARDAWLNHSLVVTRLLLGGWWIMKARLQMKGDIFWKGPMPQRIRCSFAQSLIFEIIWNTKANTKLWVLIFLIFLYPLFWRSICSCVICIDRLPRYAYINRITR